MKKSIGIMLLAIIIVSCSMKDEEILNQMSSKLDALKTIEYITIDYLKVDSNEIRIDTAKCFFDFTSQDTLIGAKYHFSNYNGSICIFNGIQEFCSDSEKKLLFLNENPKKMNLFSTGFMRTSIYVLRNLIPSMLQDSLVNFTRENDTIINLQKCYQFSISQPKFEGYPDENSMLSYIGSNLNSICVTKKDFMPYLIKCSKNKTSILTDYNTAAARADSIWDYKRFSPEYEITTLRKHLEKMKSEMKNLKGEIAPDWTLSSVRGDSISLSDFRGTPVLLMFSTMDCGGCVYALPEVQKIEKQYRDKGLKVVGVYYNKKISQLQKYIEEKQIDYPITFNCQEIAQLYRLCGVPTFVLINQDGIITYIDFPFKKESLIEEIEKIVS